MRIALAHDYLIQMGGAERVVASMHRAFPEAPIYTSAVDYRRLSPDFRDADIRTSWLQHFPGVGKRFKQYFPFYPSAFRSFDPVDAEALWISSSTFAKHLRAAPGTPRICYCHNPTRFLWQTEEYVGGEINSSVARQMVNFLIPQMRAEDRDAARRLDCVVANSRTVQKRIHDFYGINAPVIHPPVNTSRFTVSEKDRGYYLIVSRLVAYRNVELAVKTFTRLGKHLVVVGEGPDRQRLEKLAGRTVDFRGFVEERELQQIYADCKAVVVAGEEDFGITPVEAQACGKPVLALGRGGALETVIDGETGVHFREVNVQSMEAGLKKLESLNFHVARLCENAKRFSEEEYVRKITALLQDFVLQSRDRASALLAEVK